MTELYPYSANSILITRRVHVGNDKEDLYEMLNALKLEFALAKMHLENILGFEIINDDTLTKSMESDFKERLKLIRRIYRTQIEIEEMEDGLLDLWKIRLAVKKRLKIKLLEKLKTLTIISPDLSNRLQVTQDSYYSEEMADVVLVGTFEKINFINLLICVTSIFGKDFEKATELHEKPIKK